MSVACRPFGRKYLLDPLILSSGIPDQGNARTARPSAQIKEISLLVIFSQYFFFLCQQVQDDAALSSSTGDDIKQTCSSVAYHHSLHWNWWCSLEKRQKLLSLHKWRLTGCWLYVVSIFVRIGFSHRQTVLHWFHSVWGVNTFWPFSSSFLVQHESKSAMQKNRHSWWVNFQKK